MTSILDERGYLKSVQKCKRRTRVRGVGESPKMTNLEHTNDRLAKAVCFVYFPENPLKIMNVFYFI